MISSSRARIPRRSPGPQDRERDRRGVGRVLVRAVDQRLELLDRDERPTPLEDHRVGPSRATRPCRRFLRVSPPTMHSNRSALKRWFLQELPRLVEVRLRQVTTTRRSRGRASLLQHVDDERLARAGGTASGTAGRFAGRCRPREPPCRWTSVPPGGVGAGLAAPSALSVPAPAGIIRRRIQPEASIPVDTLQPVSQAPAGDAEPLPAERQRRLRPPRGYRVLPFRIFAVRLGSRSEVPAPAATGGLRRLPFVRAQRQPRLHPERAGPTRSTDPVPDSRPPDRPHLEELARDVRAAGAGGFYIATSRVFIVDDYFFRST